MRIVFPQSPSQGKHKEGGPIFLDCRNPQYPGQDRTKYRLVGGGMIAAAEDIAMADKLL